MTIKKSKKAKSVKSDSKAKTVDKSPTKSMVDKINTKGKAKKITVKALTENVKISQAKMKVDRTSQIKNRGIPKPRNEMVKTMIENGPVKKTEVVAAILKQYPTTSKKMASRTITRAKSEKYNKKYIHFKNLVLEMKIDDIAYLAFTKAAFKKMKSEIKAKAAKTKAKTEKA